MVPRAGDNAYPKFLEGQTKIKMHEEVPRVQSSEAAAELTLATLSKENCDLLEDRIACLIFPYRTFDGSCNNLCKISSGRANTSLMRFPGLLLPTAYDGDNFEPRQISSSSTPGHLNKPLPNARFVSVGVFRSSEFDINGSSPRASHLAMTWGQFLDHDVTLTELAPLPEGVSCGTNNDTCPTDNPDVCIGIDIYPAFALGGLPTAPVYSTEKISKEPTGRAVFLPQVCDKSTTVVLPARGQIQMDQSELRVEPPCEFPLLTARSQASEESRRALTAMHTIWVREHNRIALALHVLNPKWDDERLFQEARKIVIADIQHSEWLPLFFSRSIMEAAGILLEPAGTFFTRYDPHVFPDIFNSFSTAALRMGHTLIRGDFRLDIDWKKYTRHQRKMDLFAGAISEFRVRGSAFGLTFTCILTRQFKNLRFGDRFWYETDASKVGFTMDQLTQIRRITMARVLCDNVDGLDRHNSQLNAFRIPTSYRRCSQMPSVNLAPFKEEGIVSFFSSLFILLVMFFEFDYLVTNALQEQPNDSQTNPCKYHRSLQVSSLLTTKSIAVRLHDLFKKQQIQPGSAAEPV
ncbi:peroxidasin-like [Montipora foliosa]|uniref:peroxidasin-like n=1 Tax=Montipora foliosa TaxID=591990 RepID=UPI0035F16D0E